MSTNPVSSACAKIILVGEHAVVYGYPSIAIPVSSLRAKATVEYTKQPFKIIAEDLNRTFEFTRQADSAVQQLTNLVLDYLQTPPPDVTITLQSDIPIASGLGSGAAISTAIGRALAIATQQDIPIDKLNDLVYEVEKIHHGTPSGVDNTVIVYEQPIYFQRGHPIEMFKIGKPFHLIIADTGKVALTHESVGDVRKIHEAKPEETTLTFEEIEKLVMESRQAIESGQIEILGQLMIQNHRHLQALTVSSLELDKLVDVALQAGAYGAKLSGGGRGGNMIALVNEKTESIVQQALENSGAVSVFSTIVQAREQ